jgi:molybdate transport system substrate-binding protein
MPIPNPAFLLHRLCLALSVCLLAWSSQAAEVNIAVAANFAAPMKIIAQDFERETGHRAILAFGATGTFHAQIKNGAPFDVLLAADAATPSQLEKEGLAVAGSRQTYALGRLALWSRQPGLVDAQGEVLRAKSFKRLALANPKLSPYGAAAWQVLQGMGLSDKVPVVEAAHIGQVFQFVDSGNAELGFVAMSQVFEHGKLRSGSAWVVPARMHAPLRQDAVLLTHGRHKPAAQALLKHLRSDKAKAVIQAFGYEL